MPKKILVTGGAGFIGSNTVKELLLKGFEVTIIDNLSTGHKSFVNPKAKFIKGDLSDQQLLKEAVKEQDAVIHFAGSSIVQESIRNPKAYIENNIINGANLLEAMRANDINKIIFSSSAAVYGNPVRVPILETDSQNPITPYGASKSAFEKLLSCYSECYGLKFAALRYFNAYGPGEMHNPETHAIPNFVKNTLEKKPVQIFGDGTQTRDFIFTQDLANAHIQALALQKNYFLNIGSGTGCTVHELVMKIFRVIGTKTEMQYQKPRKGDSLKLVADITKAKEVMDWKPLVKLEEGLRRTVGFFESPQFKPGGDQ